MKHIVNKIIMEWLEAATMNIIWMVVDADVAADTGHVAADTGHVAADIGHVAADTGHAKADVAVAADGDIKNTTKS